MIVLLPALVFTLVEQNGGTGLPRSFESSSSCKIGIPFAALGLDKHYVSASVRVEQHNLGPSREKISSDRIQGSSAREPIGSITRNVRGKFRYFASDRFIYVYIGDNENESKLSLRHWKPSRKTSSKRQERNGSKPLSHIKIRQTCRLLIFARVMFS